METEYKLYLKYDENPDWNHFMTYGGPRALEYAVAWVNRLQEEAREHFRITRKTTATTEEEIVV